MQLLHTQVENTLQASLLEALQSNTQPIIQEFTRELEHQIMKQSRESFDNQLAEKHIQDTRSLAAQLTQKLLTDFSSSTN